LQGLPDQEEGQSQLEARELNVLQYLQVYVEFSSLKSFQKVKKRELQGLQGFFLIFFILLLTLQCPSQMLLLKVCGEKLLELSVGEVDAGLDLWIIQVAAVEVAVETGRALLCDAHLHITDRRFNVIQWSVTI
jgi:hypothetical protein